MYQKFNTTKETYTDEIDLVNILNSVRQLKVALKVLFTQNQMKIIEFANYRSYTRKCGSNKSIFDNVIETDKNDRFNKLCRQLDLDEKKLDRLSTDELNLLNEVLGIEPNNEVLNSSNITESRLIKNKIYPTIESQMSIYEEDKSSL